MQQTIKALRKFGFILALGVFVTVTSNAQSPADDPGIGGPGSPSVGVGGDGSPVVPLDRDLSIILIAAGIAYGYKQVKKSNMILN